MGTTMTPAIDRAPVAGEPLARSSRPRAAPCRPRPRPAPSRRRRESSRGARHLLVGEPPHPIAVVVNDEVAALAPRASGTRQSASSFNPHVPVRTCSVTSIRTCPICDRVSIIVPLGHVTAAAGPGGGRPLRYVPPAGAAPLLRARDARVRSRAVAVLGWPAGHRADGDPGALVGAVVRQPLRAARAAAAAVHAATRCALPARSVPCSRRASTPS